MSLEAAERRSQLVGQLRFAATLQDLRTVIVLRRQLAQELPRLRPWIRVRTKGHFPVWSRGLQGALRWPASRVARVALLSAAAGLSLRGVWSGTTPLIVAAGLALFLLGVESVEALGQETDHPSRSLLAPIDPGHVHLRHLPVAVSLALMASVVGVGAALAILPHADQVLVAAVCAVPAALGAVAGGAVSTLSGEVSTGGEAWALAAPEAAGMGLVLHTALPPALAIGGTLPVLAARAAASQGRPPVESALSAAMAVVLVFVLVAGWVRVRHEIRGWMDSQAERPEAGEGA
jgi:hypothetical protein